MGQLVTLLVFVVATLAFAIVHARRASSGGAAAMTKCPRCHTKLADGAMWCPGCKAPLQAFELVTAKVVTGEKKAETGPLHAVVRADVCVGCGTCAPVCPEAGAIEVVNKLARISLDHCVGHGACAKACPVTAILITSGAAVQEVTTPDLTPNFEARPLPGVYIVGELGGRGLIKNAINEGRLAMEAVAESLARDPRRGSIEGGIHDVAVVGAGPAGLSAGLEALHQGLRYVVLEEGTLADTISKYPRQKLLFAEPLRVPMYGNMWIADASKESLLACWQNVIEKTGLRVQSFTRVEGIERQNGTFRIKSGDKMFRARRVVLALGRRGTPRRLGVTGEETDKVFYDIVEMEAFEGQRLLVVGGGDSAIESALGLANQKGTTVTLSYRGTEFARVKDRNKEKIDDAVATGKVELLLESQVREIRRDAVVIEHKGAERVLPNDAVVVRIGGEAPYPFLERMGVRIVKKELAVDLEATGKHG